MRRTRKKTKRGMVLWLGNVMLGLRLAGVEIKIGIGVIDGNGRRYTWGRARIDSLHAYQRGDGPGLQVNLDAGRIRVYDSHGQRFPDRAQSCLFILHPTFVKLVLGLFTAHFGQMAESAANDNHGLSDDALLTRDLGADPDDEQSHAA